MEYTSKAAKRRIKAFKDQKDVTKAEDFDYGTRKQEKKTGNTKVGRREMRHLIRDKDISKKEVFEDLNRRSAEGMKLGGKVQKRLDKYNNRVAAKEKAKAAQSQTAANQQTAESAGQAEKLKNEHVAHILPAGPGSAVNTGDVEQKTKIINEQKQDVNQDNDINTTIKGDNNKVFNEQDNSIRQYGGDNRSIVINEANTGTGGGSNRYGEYQLSGTEKALEAGTLGGFFDADDSPAASAKRVDQALTMNSDYQKQFANSGSKIAAKYSGFRGGDVNMEGLQESISNFPQQMFDKATMAKVDAYGDRDANKGYVPFVFGKPRKPVTSRADEIADDYKDDIDDV